MSIEPSDAVPRAIEYCKRTNDKFDPLSLIEDLEKGFSYSRVRCVLEGLPLEDIQSDYE